MAKQSSKVRSALETEGRRIDTDRTGMQNVFNDRMGTARQRGDDTYNQALTGYNNVLNRNTNRPNFAGYENKFQNYADTAGGITDENRARIRGGGVFDEFSKTGGMSEDDVTNLRSRGSAAVPAFYQAMRNKLSNQARVTGGGGPAYSSSTSRLARDESRDLSNSVRDTELGITDTRNKGRMWGAEGMSGAETNLAGMESRNRLAGLQGAFGAAREGGDFDYRNAGLNLDAIRGIQSLRGQVPAEEFQLYENMLNNMSGREASSGHNLSTRASYDPNTSWVDRLAGLAQNLKGFHFPGGKGGKGDASGGDSGNYYDPYFDSGGSSPSDWRDSKRGGNKW